MAHTTRRRSTERLYIGHGYAAHTPFFCAYAPLAHTTRRRSTERLYIGRGYAAHTPRMTAEIKGISKSKKSRRPRRE